MGQGADGDGCGCDPVLLSVAIPKSNVYIGVQRKNDKNWKPVALSGNAYGIFLWKSENQKFLKSCFRF